ncbi:MAG: stage II sporulation protein D [Clostridia bacterium]|nr:stage II sporulation protein D [Clostridia bacterium]
MRSVVATALVLVLLLFLGPMLFLHADPLATPAEESPVPSGTLPATPTAAPLALKSDKETLVKVKLGDGTVSTLTMADYLWRVVAAEMPASFEPEALKAQAATARTYTLWKMRGEVANHPDADVCTDITCCQAYITPESAAANWGDSAVKYTQKITDAVQGTDAQAILYGGAPIDAVFFSSAAGRTEDAVAVWGNAIPYLTSVESPEGEEVPNYRTAATIPAEEFKTKFLEKYPDADLSGEPSKWFGAVTPTASGGVDTIVVGGVTVKGTAMRTLFSLRSASFSVKADAQNVAFSVTGYGHGVGMSQYGANALAKEGKTYSEILKWYYTGVTIGEPG